MPPATRHRLLLLAIALCASGCISRGPRQQAPTVPITRAEDVLWKMEAAPLPLLERIGLSVTSNDGDSLEELAPLPGVRIAHVSAGTPAALAQLRVDDVILSIGGKRVDDSEALEMAILATGSQEFSLQLRRGTVGFETQLQLPPTSTHQAPRLLSRVDPLATRAAYRTIAMGRVEVTQLFDHSPLAAAGVEPGAVIVAINGQEVTHAEALVKAMLTEHELGDTVRISFGSGQTCPIELWSPDRVTTQVSIPILFNYQHDVSRDATEWTLVNLWIIKLLNFRFEKEERHYSFLGFTFSSGVGELQELRGVDPQEHGETR